MKYLIDSNCFIQAKNMFYGFDFCPGFWEWLQSQNEEGVIYSLDKIKAELLSYGDPACELKNWAREKGDGFFLRCDDQTLVRYANIMTWADTGNFTEQAKVEFADVADSWIVAHAIAHDFTVVSHEKLDANQRTRIKIPRVCQDFNVHYCSVFEMLRDTGVKLTL